VIPGHLTRAKTTHLTRSKTPQMTGAFGEFLSYTEGGNGIDLRRYDHEPFRKQSCDCDRRALRIEP
jgi:hypothetical protein